MNPAAKDLIIDWLNANGYQATTTLMNHNVIKIEGKKQIAWIYLTLYERWGIKPGLYLLAELKNYDTQNWPTRALPSIGDPNYFSVLVGHLENGPKPF